MISTEAAAAPITKLITPAASPTVPAVSAATGGNQNLGATEFLSLLTTELKNQDPLNPVDSTQSVAQLAQFSALQATTTLATNFSNFESNFAVQQASGLLGEKVTVTTADANGNSSTGSTISGTVQSIQVVNGQPLFTMVGADGKAIVGAHGHPIQFQTNQIIGIAK